MDHPINDLNERIDEFLLRKLESLIAENQELRRLLQLILDDVSEGSEPDGREYQLLKHEAWRERVTEAIDGKD